MQNQRKVGILYQIYVLVVLGLIIVGVVTYFTQHHIKETSVHNQMEEFMSNVADDTMDSIEEYPAYEWLLKYWYENADTMDIEYDADYGPGTATEEKSRLFTQRHPDLQIKYLNEAEIEALPAEDQKLYAEIVYSWITTHIDDIKQNYNIDFLFCLVTDTDQGENPYGYQFFLLSGAEPDAVRGTKYRQVYPLGKVVSIKDNKSQQNAMRIAVENAGSGDKAYMAYAGKYIDYYTYLGALGDKAILLGLTYDFSALKAEIRDQTVQGTVHSILYQIALLALVMLLIVLAVLRPLKGVLRNIRAYTRNKESEAVTMHLSKYLKGPSSLMTRNNEVGQLAEDITALADEIDNYVNKIETITAEKERIGIELELASKIQANMLPNIFPPFPERTEIDLYASMTPAREVGGDFYDFFFIDDDHLAITIADVSGKGIPAALFMMVSRIMIHNMAAAHEESPAKALERANNEICANNDEDMFVTVWLGILEISTGRLVASNAGHEYPAYNPDGSMFSRYSDKHGFVIGSMEDISYTDYEIIMQPGAKLFVYTDGLTEATDRDNNMFGEERLMQTLYGARDDSPEQIIGAVNRDVKAFVGEAEQFDDLTMLCIEYKGNH
ncbi:MAG: PP2C family protein-serine/threonine phosphatase [Bacillota bacterium]|nr:PP2C family protein-serine/threonine phosphatase [Bacillota bacterium]